MVNIDWSLYLVTDPILGGETGRDLIDIVRRAVDGGVSVVQLRDKDASDDDFRRTTERLLDALGDVPLFVNDRAHLAAEFGTHLHLGQSDLGVAEARTLLREEQLIGLSVGSDAELEACLALPGRRPDVLGLGPVYSTTTKADAPAGVGPDIIAGWADRAARADLATVAIGGITTGNAHTIHGVDGICVVSALMTAPDPTVTADALRKEFSR